MNLSLVPYKIHDSINHIVNTYHLKCFSMAKYVYDDVEENFKYLQSLDPKEWRAQDHYAVLRISKIRINASAELIKKAYRKQLLDHHPDKGRYRLSHNCKQSSDANSDYFCCITSAYETLSDISKRRSYDSYDPEFNDEIPTPKEVKTDFFGVLHSVFELNSVWSKKQPVPFLGDDNTPIEEVHRFYNFWEEFRTWREWTYTLEADEAENREERRWNDRQKKGERKQLAQDEAKRIRGLVEMAKKYDPRLKLEAERWKQQKEEDKRQKEEKRRQRIAAAEQARREEEERKRLEEEAKNPPKNKAPALSKKEKEAKKSQHKGEKRKLRKYGESKDFFIELLKEENDKKSVEMRVAEVKNLIEIFCMKLTMDELTDMNEKVVQLEDSECLAFLRKEEERLNKLSEEFLVNNQDSTTDKPQQLTSQLCGDRPWTFELTQLLIRSINTHPAGIPHRWSVIADFMNDHTADLNVTERQVIGRAKALKNNDSDIKKEAVIHQQEILSNGPAVNGDKNSKHASGDVKNISKHLESVKITDRSESELNGMLPWTADEQKSLETALREFTKNDPQRWEKISGAVGTRTKKECVLRFKELAERLKKTKDSK